MSAEAYNIGLTRRYVQELYPVLLDAHGNVIDGNNRLDEYPNWRTETLSHITTPAQLWAARIIANGCRRIVSRSERAEQFSELARCLVDEGVTKDRLAAVISEIITFSERYVQLLLPAEYKRVYKSDLRSQSAEAGQVTVPAAVQPRGRQLAPAGSSDGRMGPGAAETGTPEPQAGGGLLPQPSAGAPANPEDQVTVPAASRKGELPVAHDTAQAGTPGPNQLSAPASAESGAGAPGHPGPEETREAALEYIRRYYDKYPRPDPDYLSWEVAINVGVSEKEALELIGQVQRERGIAEPIRNAQGSVTCPLCSRDGAERSAILSRVQNPQIGQLTLWEFVMEEMR